MRNIQAVFLLALTIVFLFPVTGIMNPLMAQSFDEQSTNETPPSTETATPSPTETPDGISSDQAVKGSQTLIQKSAAGIRAYLDLLTKIAMGTAGGVSQLVSSGIKTMVEKVKGPADETGAEAASPPTPEAVDNLVRQVKKVEDDSRFPESAKIERLKAELKGARYSVELRDGDDPETLKWGFVIARDAKQSQQPRYWTSDQLKAVKMTLDLLPTEFRSGVKKIHRLQVMDDIHAAFIRNAPDSIMVFDLAFPKNASPEIQNLHMQKVLIHEITHAFHFGKGKKFAADFEKEFWYHLQKPVTTWSMNSLTTSEKVTIRSHRYPRGISTTQFGSVWDNTDPKSWGNYPQYWDDLCESVAMFFLYPNRFRLRFPKRNAFVKKMFAEMNLPPRPENEPTIEPEKLGFCLWGKPGDWERITDEMFPLSLGVGKGTLEWVFLSPALDPKTPVASLSEIFEEFEGKEAPRSLKTGNVYFKIR